MFWPLVWVIFIYCFFQRRLPWGPIAILLAIAFLLVPANLAYRTTLRSTEKVDVGSLDSVVPAVVRTLSDSWHIPAGRAGSPNGSMGLISGKILTVSLQSCA